MILESGLPKVLDDIVGFMGKMKSIFAGNPLTEAPANMTKEPDGDEPVKVVKPKGADISPELPKSTLSAKAEEAAKKLEACTKEMEACKEAAEKD